MTAYFQYRDENSIVSKCKNGLEVVINFDDGMPCDVYFADGEWIVDDDALYDIGAYVQDGSKEYAMVPLSYLVMCAGDEYHEIMAGVELERAAEARHEKSMSDSSRYI